jgi:hypothetical protein
VLKSCLLVVVAGVSQIYLELQNSRVVKTQASRLERTKYTPDSHGLENPVDK